MTQQDDFIARRQRQAPQDYYLLDVPRAASAAGLSVLSFELREQFGDNWQAEIELTHPQRLPRQDYVGRYATFAIALPGAAPRRFQGSIAQLSHLRATADEHVYQLVLRAHPARLTLGRACRVHQRQTAPKIIETLLRHHGFVGHQFAFKLRRAYPEHAFRLQYQQSDWDYIRLLMAQEGIYCYFIESEYGPVLVFADDIDHYFYPALKLPLHGPAGLNPQGEAILTLRTHAYSVPGAARVGHYDPDHAIEPITAQASLARQDPTTYGERYEWNTGHASRKEAERLAALRHEAVLAQQVIYEGRSDCPALRPAQLIKPGIELPDAAYGSMVITEIVHRGARHRSYLNDFRAIPGDRPYRLPADPASWPSIPGTLAATVVPLQPGQRYAPMDKQGRYRVRLQLDSSDWPANFDSLPLRLAKPFAGQRRTGLHFPLLSGTEVAIGFRGGNPNLPYIQSVQHNETAPDLVTLEERWYTRHVLRTLSDNKLQMEDWEGHEHIKLSTPHSGKSQLTLGRIVDGQRQERGAGFELRSDAHGAIRAGQGLLLSTDARPGAQGAQLDMQQAVALLQQALAQSETLAATARAAQASAADCERQRALLHTTMDQLKQAGILASAPQGIALASGTDLQLSADQNLIGTAGAHADFSVLKRFTIAAGELFSVCAQKLGIQLFATRGSIDLQAQSDAVKVTAAKDVRIVSVGGKVRIEAPQGIELVAGGAYLKLEGGNVEVGAPGDLLIKTITLQKHGAASMPSQLPAMPRAAPGALDAEFRRTYASGRPAAGCRYAAALADGNRCQGTLDAAGYARLSGVTAAMARVRYLDDPNPPRFHTTMTQATGFNALNTAPGAGHKDAEQ